MAFGDFLWYLKTTDVNMRMRTPMRRFAWGSSISDDLFMWSWATKCIVGKFVLAHEGTTQRKERKIEVNVPKWATGTIWPCRGPNMSAQHDKNTTRQNQWILVLSCPFIHYIRQKPASYPHSTDLPPLHFNRTRAHILNMYPLQGCTDPQISRAPLLSFCIFWCVWDVRLLAPSMDTGGIRPT